MPSSTHHLPGSKRGWTASQVQLREDAGPTEFLESGRDQGKWIWELDSLGVHSSIIDTRPQGPALLTHEEEAGCHWRTGWPDVTLVESLLDILLHSLVLRDGQRIHSTPGEFISRQQIYSTVPWRGCLLAEDILECPIIRLDSGSHAGLGTLNPRGGDLSGGCLERWAWNFLETMLKTKFAPANYLTCLPSDFWRVSQGHPRMISTVVSSSTRNLISSSCRLPIWSFIGGDSNLTYPRPCSFPLMVSTQTSWACRWRGRCRRLRRSWEMKLPEEPESTRAEAVTNCAGVNSCTVSTESLEITGSIWRVLTAGLGGLMGQDLMKWSAEAQ